MRKGLRECPPMSLRPLFLLLVLLVAAKASADTFRLGILSTEQTIRSQIELYRVQHYGELPWAPGEVAQKQWAPLVDEDYLQLRGTPNPHVSEQVATTIVELTEPGDIGANIDRATAGWAWNSTDEMLYAIGVPYSVGCVVAQRELAQEREDRIWLLLKAFAGVIVLAAFLYAARAFGTRLPGA